MSFVRKHRAAYGVEPLLAAIGEPVSTYYDRISRPPSTRTLSDAALAERIEAIWEDSRRSYGSPRVHAMLASQYTALNFSQRLHDAGVTASMGSTGDSYDNAMAESFFGTIKTELLYRQRWDTRHDADRAIFDWIEAWYNPRRIQADLGMRSPDEYEADFYANRGTPVAVGTQ